MSQSTLWCKNSLLQHKTYFICFKGALSSLKQFLAAESPLRMTQMTSQPGKQTIAIHILPNISRSKS